MVASSKQHILSGQENSRPVPDPTELTRIAMADAKLATADAVRCLREVIDAQFAGYVARTADRFASMDKAVELLHMQTAHTPTEIDTRIGTMRTLIDEKIDGIQRQFKERDIRATITATDSKEVGALALQAAKDLLAEQNRSSALATAKSEAATTKQIDAQAQMIVSASVALDGKISDIKDRIGRIESEKKGGAAVWGVVGAVGASMIAIVLSILNHVSLTQQQPQPYAQYQAPPVIVAPAVIPIPDVKAK